MVNTFESNSYGLASSTYQLYYISFYHTVQNEIVNFFNFDSESERINKIFKKVTSCSACKKHPLKIVLEKNYFCYKYKNPLVSVI